MLPIILFMFGCLTVSSIRADYSLSGGVTVYENFTLTSNNSLYKFKFQTDGNLVLCRVSDDRALWASDTANSSGNHPYHLTMENNWNFVLYDKDSVTVWSSNSNGVSTSNSYFMLQDDGNMVVYGSSASASTQFNAKWASTTVQSEFHASQWMAPLKTNDFLRSNNGNFSLRLASDGNLILTRVDVDMVLWKSNTASTSAHLKMQTDGNLILYDSTGALWSTGTTQSGNWLKLQDDGNLVLYGSDGTTPRWASNSVQRNTLLIGEILNNNQYLISSNGKYKLLMQTDGNLVLYKTSDLNGQWSLWASGTSTGSSTTLMFYQQQVSGSIVLTLCKNGGASYQLISTSNYSNTETGISYIKLVMQDDGNVVFYTKEGELAPWSTGTATR